MFFGKKKKKVLLFGLVVTIMSNKAFASSYFIRDNRNIRFTQLKEISPALSYQRLIKQSQIEFLGPYDL